MLLFGVVCLLFTQAYVFALQVSPGSTCASICMDSPESDPLNPASSTTTVGDITCDDDDYDSTSKGIKYKNCLECLQKSPAVNGTENDISWFLYNIRYSVDVCVYGFPNASKSVSSPCDLQSACEPLKTALEADSLNSTNVIEFGYCDANGGSFSGTQVDACIQCFDSSSNQAYMANFITVLKAGCQQRPDPGVLLGLSGSPFTSTLINITDAPTNQTALSSPEDSTAMTTGAIVGIAVGASLLFLGGTALFWVYYRRQKRLYGDDFDSHYDPRAGNKSISPPLVGGFNSTETNEHSQLSDYELKAQQTYNSNAAYYDTIEKEMQMRRPQYAFDPNKPGSGPSGALPTHPAYINRALGRNSSRDLSPQPLPPVKSNKPDSYALTTYLNAAEDALKLPGPPPGPPPPATNTRGPSPQPSVCSLPHPSHARTSSNSSVRSSSRLTGLQPPPPPPPSRQPKVPSLILPSVPRIRMPKKYAPPKINIEGATPIAEQGEVLPIGMEISNPVIEHDKRFVEDPFEARRKANEVAAQRIVEQSVVDRRPRAFVEEVPIHTGKSSMYG